MVEHVVGLFDRERVGGASPLSAADFDTQLARLVATGRIDAEPSFSDAQLDAVRARIDALHDDWATLAPGGVLELCFARPAGAAEGNAW